MIARVTRPLAALAALLFALTLAQPAAAQPLLDDGDAAELAQSLADATEEQDICYGWSVLVTDDSGGPSGIDSGSSNGPGAPIGTAIANPCERTVELSGSIGYTCGSCESEDSSSVSVTSSFPGGPTTGDLEDLGLKGGDLKNDNGDVVLQNMVGALPLLVASKGLADPIPVEPSTVAPAASDKPTNSPAIPDWLRDSWLPLTALLVLIIGGVIWLVQILATERQRGARRRRAEGRKNRTGGGFTPPTPGTPADSPADPSP